MDKYINTIIEHNYSKYHIKNRQKIAKINKIITTKKHKNRQKQHSTIIAIYRKYNYRNVTQKNHIQNDIQL